AGSAARGRARARQHPGRVRRGARSGTLRRAPTRTAGARARADRGARRARAADRQSRPGSRRVRGAAVSARRIAVRAPAKVNLTLEVRGRRPDGHHELDSVMMALELGDELVAELDGERGGEVAGRGCALALGGPAAAGVPGDATNLALR